jgi:hypothetical protein
MRVFLCDLETLLNSDQSYEEIKSQLLGLSDKAMTLGINGSPKEFIRQALVASKLND